MKKKDIIQLVKESIKETHTPYAGQSQFGNRQGPSGFSTSAIAPAGKDPYTGKNEYPHTVRPKRTASGYMQENESTSFKVVNADTGKTIDFGLDQAKAEEIVALAKEDNINAKIVKMKNVDDVGKLNEFTSMGQEGIYPRKEEPGDMFQQQEVEELLPNGMASRDDRAFQDRLKQHADWTEESGYNNTFVHIQYHDSFDREHSYRIHQSQNYNGNYDDFRNPKFTVLTITKKKEGKEEELGRYIVDTDAYLKDFAKLRNDDVLGKQVSEDYKPSHRAYDVIDKSKNDEIVFKKLSRDRALEKAHKNPNYMIVATDSLANENKELTDNPKLQPGKTVIYSGTRYEVIENSGYVLTLKSLESGNELKLNLGQLKDRPIKENNMKKQTKEGVVSIGPDANVGDFGKIAMANKTNKKTIEKAYDQAKKSGMAVSVATGIQGEGDGDGKDYNEMMRDISNKMSTLPREDHEDFLTKLGKFIEAKKSRLEGVYEQDPDDEMDDRDEERGWMDGHLQEYMKERAGDNLKEHMDKHRKRAKLMESAWNDISPMFKQEKNDDEIVQHYVTKGIAPEHVSELPRLVKSFRDKWNNLQKIETELKILNQEAEQLKQSAQPTVSGMEGGMEEEKQLASGLFN